MFICNEISNEWCTNNKRSNRMLVIPLFKWHFFAPPSRPLMLLVLPLCLRVFKRGRRNGDGNGAGTKLRKKERVVSCGVWMSISCVVPLRTRSLYCCSSLRSRKKIGRVIPEKHKEKERRKRKEKEERGEWGKEGRAAIKKTQVLLSCNLFVHRAFRFRLISCLHPFHRFSSNDISLFVIRVTKTYYTFIQRHTHTHPLLSDR